MKKLIGIAATALLVLGMIPAAGAVEVERTIEIDDEDHREGTWTSDMFAGVAPGFFTGDYECGDPIENCEYTLIAITGLTAEEIAAAEEAGTAERLRDRVHFVIGITDYSVPASDLDIIIYESDSEGNKGSEIGRVGEIDTDPSEEFYSSFTATASKPTQYFLLEVVFFAGAGTYVGYARA